MMLQIFRIEYIKSDLYRASQILKWDIYFQLLEINGQCKLQKYSKKKKEKKGKEQRCVN